LSKINDGLIKEYSIKLLKKIYTVLDYQLDGMMKINDSKMEYKDLRKYELYLIRRKKIDKADRFWMKQFSTARGV